MSFSKEKIDQMETIIDVNCIDCPFFRKSLSSSPCLCDPMLDLFERSPVYRDDDAYNTRAASLWEYVRKKILQRESARRVKAKKTIKRKR